MKLTEKEKEQILKNWAEAMSKIIERMSIEMWELEEENKKLKERIDELEKCNLNLQERLDRKEELNKGYRKEIKDHQLYEEKLEHRIVEFEELLHWE
jgi:hypothetical protein